jgi:hypothetical protein
MSTWERLAELPRTGGAERLHLPEPPAGLPASPLAATPAALGFRWE